MQIQHRLIPDSERHEPKGASTAPANTFLKSKGDGTTEFATVTRFGFRDIADSATSSTPITLTSPGTAYKLTNNGLGAQSLSTYQIPEISTIWNTSTNNFAFSTLPLGTVIELRIDIEVSSVPANTNLNLYLSLGTGGGAYQINIDDIYCKNSGTYKITRNVHFYIGNANTKDNPGSLWIKSDNGSPTVKVNGWFVKASLQ